MDELIRLSKRMVNGWILMDGHGRLMNMDETIGSTQTNDNMTWCIGVDVF